MRGSGPQSDLNSQKVRQHPAESEVFAFILLSLWQFLISLLSSFDQKLLEFVKTAIK